MGRFLDLSKSVWDFGHVYGGEVVKEINYKVLRNGTEG